MVNGIGLTDNYMKIEQDDTPEPLVNSMYWECEAWRVDKWRPFYCPAGLQPLFRSQCSTCQGDNEVITSSNDERGKSDEETV